MNAQMKFLNAVKTSIGDINTITRQQVLQVCKEHDLAIPMWLVADRKYRIGRGVYSLQMNNDRPKDFDVENHTTSHTTVAMAATVHPISSEIKVEIESLIPSKVSGYVPFGNFSDVRKIVKSGRFYPMYITGLSGNGKTMMVEQVCAAENRECVRVNVTIETDEDDMLGGFRLVNGQTVWHNGPVITAMERGAILLLDEVDLGSNKLMCLQPVLEGKSVFLKKINKLITPKNGFNIIATANTKGKGSDDGRFVGTNVMNEAFLERFSVTLEQDYPSNKAEVKILKNLMAKSNIENDEFVQRIVSWAEVIRKSFMEGAVSDIISTRRLVHICEAFVIFGNEKKSIELCLNRFDSETKKSFMDLYDKMDETNGSTVQPTTTETTDEVAF